MLSDCSDALMVFCVVLETILDIKLIQSGVRVCAEYMDCWSIGSIFKMH